MDNLKIDASAIFQTRDGFVADRLREAILSGVLKPGQRLDQNEIAEALNVSRSPVREALRTLAAEGLVQILPHRGAIVAELSPEELEEIYAIRAVLEGMAARLAVPNMDLARLEELETILHELNATDDLDLWLELNRRFHHTIYQAAGRPRLLSLIENLRNTSAPYIRQYIDSSEHMEEAKESHQRIFEACARGDAAAARRETEKHLKAVCQGMLVFVRAGAEATP